MDVFQLGRLAGRFLVEKPTRPLGVEANYPVPDDLNPHPAECRGLASSAPRVDRAKGQQAAGLAGVFALAGQTPQSRGVIVGAAAGHESTSRTSKATAEAYSEAELQSRPDKRTGVQ